jgi:hypothetical protein
MYFQYLWQWCTNFIWKSVEIHKMLCYKNFLSFFFESFLHLLLLCTYELISIMFQQQDWWEVVDEKLLFSCVNYQFKNAFLIFLLTYVNIVVKYLFMKRKSLFHLVQCARYGFCEMICNEILPFFCYVNITFHLLIVSKWFVKHLFFCFAKLF